jgi:hypothetical protein
MLPFFKKPATLTFEPLLEILYAVHHLSWYMSLACMRIYPWELLAAQAIIQDHRLAFAVARSLMRTRYSQTQSATGTKCGKSVHDIVCDDLPLRKKLVGRPNFLIYVSEDCIVLAKPDYVYIALSYVWS